MTLRVAIKYLAIALLVECIIMMFKHPIMLEKSLIAELFGSTAYEWTMIFFNDIFVVIQAIIYLAFCYHIHLFDIQFTDAFFGRAFRIEMALTMFSVALMFLPFDKLVYAYIVKVVLELLFAANCVYAGIGIYNYFRTEPFKKIRLSYFIWSARHVIYGLILVYDTVGIIDNTRPEATDSSLVVYWILLMPMLLVSRLVLIRGCSELATLPANKIKEKEEEEESINE